MLIKRVNFVQQEYSSMNVGITMGIIAGVIFPLLVLFGCIVYHLFMGSRKEKAELNNPTSREGVVLTNYEDQEVTPLQSTQRETEVM